MNDLARLIDDLCAGLDAVEPGILSTPVETLSTGNALQDIENTHCFHNSHSFHSQKTDSGFREGERLGECEFTGPGSCASSSHVRCVEIAERVEIEAERSAGSTLSLFPLSDEEVERVEREHFACGRSTLDLNCAAPQRSDWWTGPAMAEADRLMPPAGAPLPIAPADVRAGIERELRRLADLGATGPEVQRRAVEIVRAKVGNSPALAVRQLNTGRCAVCDAPMGEAEAAVAVLNPGGAPLHLHASCHDAYRAARRALVDRIMAAAGYGADEQAGEAA